MIHSSRSGEGVPRRGHGLRERLAEQEALNTFVAGGTRGEVA